MKIPLRSDRKKAAFEVEEELQFHIAMLERKYTQQGMSHAQAKAAAGTSSIPRTSVCGPTLSFRSKNVRRGVRLHDDRGRREGAVYKIDGLGRGRWTTAEIAQISAKIQRKDRIERRLAEIELDKTVSGRKAWQAFRELTKPKWPQAFIDAVEAATGARKFTYVLAVTAVFGDKRTWERYPFLKAMDGNPGTIVIDEEIPPQTNIVDIPLRSYSCGSKHVF